MLLLLLLGPISACRAPVQPPDGFEGRWSPRALALRSVEAYGGGPAVLDFEDLAYECEISIQADRGWVTGTTTLRFKKPDWFYSSLNLRNGGEKIQFYDGLRSGERINGTSTDRDIGTDLDRRRRSTLIHAFLLEEGGEPMELSGRGEAGGMRCAVLTKRAGVEIWKVWIDLERFLIRKIRLLLPPGDAASGVAGPLSVEWRFSDFKEVEGRQVPHVYEQHLNGKLFQKGRITSFRLNGGLTQDDFRPPRGT